MSTEFLSTATPARAAALIAGAAGLLAGLVILWLVHSPALAAGFLAAAFVAALVFALTSRSPL
ncbi:hypothetical protein, partial [Sphingomonas bacterium]|uniref:hypothetical protein n=1 Tax=Sphingomonas bacterium TaxID=1895847 RepID=UPI001C2DD20B